MSSINNQYFNSPAASAAAAVAVTKNLSPMLGIALLGSGAAINLLNKSVKPVKVNA